VGFVVDKVASGQVFSEYFGFSCQKPLIPPTSPSSSSSQTYKGKIEVPPIGDGPHVTPFKEAKGSRDSKLAQRNVDF
jgi:hypothetical protein